MRSYLIVIFISLSAAQARSETIGAYSVEWLTSASRIVAVGEIKSVEKVKGPSEVVYEIYTFKPAQIFKGKGAKTFSFTIRTFSTEPVFEHVLNLNDRIIVFLKDYDSGEQFLKGKLVPTTDQVPLSVAKTDGLKFFISLNFKVMKNEEELLGPVKEALRSEAKYLKTHKHSEIRRFYLEAPMGSEADRALYAGSTTFLFVPNFMSRDAREKLF